MAGSTRSCWGVRKRSPRPPLSSSQAIAGRLKSASGKCPRLRHDRLPALRLPPTRLLAAGCQG